MQKKENLDKVYEELKQKVLAQTQQLSRYRKRQNQYYQNKMQEMLQPSYTEKYVYKKGTN